MATRGTRGDPDRGGRLYDLARAAGIDLSRPEVMEFLHVFVQTAVDDMAARLAPPAPSNDNARGHGDQLAAHVAGRALDHHPVPEVATKARMFVLKVREIDEDRKR